MGGDRVLSALFTLLVIFVTCCDGILFGPVQISIGSEKMKCKKVSSSHTFSTKKPYHHLPIPKCFVPKFLMYTRTTTAEYSKGKTFTIDNIPSIFGPKKQTIFLVHGFQDYPKKGNRWMIKSTENLLKKGDFNVIMVDWSKYGDLSILKYKQAAANTRVTAMALKNLVMALYKKGLHRSRAYCVGHSLGAHVCGYAGQFLGSDKKFGRITGLDPAGPDFRNLPSKARLSSGDAVFVDVIHTDMGNSYLVDFGIASPIGHLDFYPNGGKRQNGCINKRSENFDGQVDELDELLKKRGYSSNVTDALYELEDAERKELAQVLLDENHKEADSAVKTLQERASFLSCSHSRAVKLFYESILMECKPPTHKCTYKKQKMRSCSSCGSKCPLMGYYASPSYRGVYKLSTPSKSPFCENKYIGKKYT